MRKRRDDDRNSHGLRARPRKGCNCKSRVVHDCGYVLCVWHAMPMACWRVWVPVRGMNRQPSRSQGTKSQVCDLRVFAPQQASRACRAASRTTQFSESQKLLPLPRSMFLGCAGKVQARRALPQADWQAPFLLFSDMTRISIHAVTLGVVDIDPQTAAAALAAWWVHSCGPCVSLQHAAAIVHER